MVGRKIKENNNTNINECDEKIKNEVVKNSDITNNNQDGLMETKDKEEIDDSEKIAEGQILVRAIIEMLGAPKEHIQKTMNDYLESLKLVKKYKIIKTYISEAVEQKENNPTQNLAPGTKLFSIFAEMEIWFKDIGKLVEFCFDSLPSSIEIIEPESFRFKGSEFAGLLNDLQAKLHKLDMVFKMNNADKQATVTTFNTLITNFIVHCIKTGNQTDEKIASITGIDKERINKILENLTEKKVIYKKGNIYSKE
jgi:hypothetical protein